MNCRFWLVLFLAAALTASAATPREEWNNNMAAAARWNAEGNFTQVELALKAALVAANKLGPATHEAALALDQLGSAYFILGRMQSSEHSFLGAIRIWEKSAVTPNFPLAKSLSGLVDVYLHTGRLLAAERLPLQSVLNALEAGGAPANQLALLVEAIALVHSEAKRFEQAESMYLRALNLWRSSADSDKRTIAVVLGNIGDFYAVHGQYSKAESYLEQSIEAWSLLGAPRPESIQPLLNLASIQEKLRRNEKAAQLLERALGLIDKHLSPDHPLLVLALENYADVLRSLKRGTAAKAADRRAKALMKSAIVPSEKHTIDIRELEKK